MDVAVCVHNEWNIQRRQVLNARMALGKAAIALQAAIAEYDQAFGKKFRKDEVAPAPIDSLLRQVLAWVNEEPPIFRYTRRGRGRPEGRVAHAHVSDWVARLLVAVRRCGGDLTFDKNRSGPELVGPRAEITQPSFPHRFYSFALTDPCRSTRAVDCEQWNSGL
jgi:hypothetical protein